MKKIEAIIRRSKLAEVQKALSDLGIQGATVIEAGGFGHQRGHQSISEFLEEDVTLVPKSKLEIVTNDAMVDKIVEKIRFICHSGQQGDGKIFISAIEEVIRIRTGQTGEEAL
jgi:nitrogen regulatory protein PII